MVAIDAPALYRVDRLDFTVPHIRLGRLVRFGGWTELRRALAGGIGRGLISRLAVMIAIAMAERTFLAVEDRRGILRTAALRLAVLFLAIMSARLFMEVRTWLLQSVLLGKLRTSCIPTLRLLLAGLTTARFTVLGRLILLLPRRRASLRRLCRICALRGLRLAVGAGIPATVATPFFLRRRRTRSGWLRRRPLRLPSRRTLIRLPGRLRPRRTVFGLLRLHWAVSFAAALMLLALMRRLSALLRRRLLSL
ncbi:MAG TPA: hypothetical protein VHC00_15665 [Rhizobiaceae bacterium]|nr:hypothetical protein [Rhizobiaceae bacterium]